MARIRQQGNPQPEQFQAGKRQHEPGPSHTAKNTAMAVEKHTMEK
jgi:hypothetical protein